jgi:tellurite resistance protein
MSTTTATLAPPPARTLEYLPIGLFGSVMGLTGLGIAWQLAHQLFGLPQAIAEVIEGGAVLAFVVLVCAYLVKWVNAPDAVKAEFAHPIAGSLFGTVLISLLLLPIVLAPLSRPLALAVWLVGAVGMVGFAWFMVDRWMQSRQQLAHATPTWIVPVVGMLDLPLAMPALGLQSYHGVMVLGLAVGLFFAVPLFTLIFSRLVFEAPLPDALQPTLLILVAPFAVGTSTYIVTAGSVDLVAQCLFALTLFMLAVLLGRLRYLAACCPFRVSWWAVSFPLAASAIAGLRIAAVFETAATEAIAGVLLALATAAIGYLMVRTLSGVVRGELRAITL